MSIDAAFPGIEGADVRIYRAFDRIAGCSVDVYEIFCICAIERFIRASRVLEIGTYDGNTTLNLAANVERDGRVVTVDLPIDVNGVPIGAVTDESANLKPRRTGEQYEGTTQANAITQVFADSTKLDWTQLDGPFDLVFIDGCHDLQCVRMDTENALGQLAPDGVLIWHDYGAIREVSRVVDDLAVRRPVHALRGTRLAVMRASRLSGIAER